jgi:hypothetical protein
MTNLMGAVLAATLAMSSGGSPAPLPLDTLLKNPEAARTFNYWRLREGRSPAELPALGARLTHASRAGACQSDAEREIVTGLATAASAGTEAQWRVDRDAGAATVAQYRVAWARVLAHQPSGFPGLDKAMADDLADWRGARSPRAAALLRQVVIDQLPMNALTTAIETGTLSDGALAYLNAVSELEQCRNSLAQTRWLKREVARGGWFIRSRDGEPAATAAWLIAQHADQDMAFQKDALDRLERLLPSGDLDRSEYAFLWDRIAVNEGRLQRYGTQFKGCVNDRSEPAPMENPAGVDTRRATLGMESLEVYNDIWSKARHCGR